MTQIIKSDIEIAQNAKLESITKVAQKLALEEDALYRYGDHIAKVMVDKVFQDKTQTSNLILVTAINPTAAGEGKTTVSIGLADALSLEGKQVCLALREPSLGPVFGMKGGATGGGYSQVVPMEDINLHFTGDFHAITSANNLLSAIIDNSIHQGNELQIDPKKVVWRRCIDMNDRALRDVVMGLGAKANGQLRQDGFDITTASETMAIFCLSKDINDLKEKLGNIIVAYSYSNKPITARELKANGAMAALLVKAINPNLVQTLAGTPAIVHGGPFANIAHGCNSIIATKLAQRVSDYVVTEAGFGADLGCEKFIDIKCRIGNIAPKAIVVVATIRALKSHGGVSKNDLSKQNLQALQTGFSNLEKHCKNITNVFGAHCVVAINAFASDTQEETKLLLSLCKDINVEAVFCDVWAKGGEGAKLLAQKVIQICEKNKYAKVDFAYLTNDNYVDKITSVAKKIYGAKEVVFETLATKKLEKFKEEGFDGLPVCIAKTQYSFSDDATKLGAPKDFSLKIRDVRLSSGAGFVVAFAGNIISMPGLPKTSAANEIDIDQKTGNIIGLF